MLNVTELDYSSNVTSSDLLTSNNQKVKQILVVDDEPLVCWSIKNCLSKAGYSVVTAESAERAIEKLYTTCFDLIVTDMKLPQHDGFDVAEMAHKLSPKTPVIMITAFGDSVSRERAQNTNISRFIDKPFNMNEFTKLVSSLLH